MSGRPFVDTNILIYYFTPNDERKDRAGEILAEGVTLSVQVLNELAHVARRKLRVSWEQFRQFRESILDMVPEPDAITLRTHLKGEEIASRYKLSIYDGLIVASALEAGCAVLYTEDLQHGQTIEGLHIVNPFL